MNPLTDDPVDADLRAALRRIEGASPLSIDVDGVIARGRSRRRAAVAERVLTVGLVLAVVIGAAAFALRSSASRDVVLGPLPTAGSQPARIDPRELIVDLGGEYADPRAPRTGSVVLLLSNQTGQRVTITGWSLVDAPATSRAALATPIAQGAYESLSVTQQRELLAAPVRSTVTLDPSNEVNLVVQLPASCTAADRALHPSIVLDVRAQDGRRWTQTIGRDQFAGVMPGGDALDWVDWIVLKACGDTLPYPTPSPRPSTPEPNPFATSTRPEVTVQGAGSNHDKSKSRTGTTALELYNGSGRTVTITDWRLDDPSGSTTAALDAPLPLGQGMSVGPPSVEDAVLGAPRRASATLVAGQGIKLVLEIHASCTASDKAIRPTVVLDLRWADGTTGQTVIHPLDGWDKPAPGVTGRGWVAVTIAQACATS